MTRSSALASRLLAAACVLCSATTGAADEPPRAPRGELTSSYAGVSVADPYRGLEDLKSDSNQAWVAAQAAYTRQQLDRLPGLPALRQDLAALDADQPALVSSVTVTRSGRWFYLKRPPGANGFKLFTRARAGAAEQVLLDPEAWTTPDGQKFAINNFSVAPGGRHVAAVVSRGDAELGELRVVDTRTRREVLPAVPGIWGELAAAWSADGRSLLYAQGADALRPGGEPFGRLQVFRRRLAGGSDLKLLGHGEQSGPEVRAADWVYVDEASSPGFLLSTHWEGVSSNARLWLRRGPNGAWRQLFDTDAGVRGVGAAGRHVYVRSFKDAPRYRLLRYDLQRPAAPPLEVVPQATGVIEAMTVAADGVYYTLRSGSTAELFRLRHGARPGTAERVALPFAGAPSLFEASPEVPGVVFRHEGWTHPMQVLRALGTRVSATPLVPPGRSTVGQDWVAREETCRSHDGVEVPMSVIHRRDLALDGSHPVLMDGYGGYGVAELAEFLPRMDAWYRRGGVFAVVDPRGGGAYGREWYQAGVGARKANTWLDMIACAQTLIARGYTTAGRLAIQGTSMGGVAAGRAITTRPDLFAVGIVRVGITETVRFIEATSNGPNHEDEMGSLKTEAGVRQLLAMSTYHQVRDGERYPALLFTTGLNDNRVAPWIPMKTFARVAAASASGKPVLLRVDGAGGHGMSAGAGQRQAELADRLAFVLWNTGDAGFQPPADR